MILHLLCEFAAGFVLALFLALTAIVAFYILMLIGSPCYRIIANDWPWVDKRAPYSTGMELVVSAGLGLVICAVMSAILMLGAWYCQ